MLNILAAIAPLLVPRSRFLNQLLVANTGGPLPLSSVKLTALATVPPTVPKLKVSVDGMATPTNPPLPVQVKLVAVFIDSTTVFTVVLDKTILLVPNASERTFVLSERNTGQVRLNPFNEIVPLVRVTVVAATPLSVNALPNVNVAAALLNVILPGNVVPLVVIVVLRLAEVKVIRPVPLHTVPASKVILLPDIVGVPAPEKVIVFADTVKLEQTKAPVKVTV